MDTFLCPLFSNFVVCCCLLVFSLLLSLRADNIITWNYAIIFLPLWVWNTLVLAGLIVGVVFWIKKKRLRCVCVCLYIQAMTASSNSAVFPFPLSLPLRQEPEHVQHFKALLLSAALQFPVFLTELLVVINIETSRHQWRAIFIPLYFLSGAAIIPCVWACWRKRSVDVC